MPQVRVAVIRARNASFVLVPVEASFGAKSRIEQQTIVDQMALAAERSRMPRHVVPVWDKGGGRLGFRAPQALQPVLREMKIEQVHQIADSFMAY